MRKLATLAAALAMAGFQAAGSAAGPAKPSLPPGAAWELRLLGIDAPAKIAQLRALAGRRVVKLAIVGTGGVSKRLLESKLSPLSALEYRMGPNFPNSDPGRRTHDTSAMGVVLDLTNALGVRLHVRVYQPADKVSEVAKAFRAAGKDAHVVSLYQTFWSDSGPILEAIRAGGGALFISPYGEVGKPTSLTPQGHAHRPWGKGVDHFVTAAPLARRKSNGKITNVSDRGPKDTEIINFLAPSYYASGPGGTCPAAEVAVAVACYIYASAPAKPDPTAVVSLMRRTAKVDEDLIASTPPFSRETVETFKKSIERYVHPPAGKRRRLDAPGLLNLYGAYLRIRSGWPGQSDSAPVRPSRRGSGLGSTPTSRPAGR